MSDTPRQNPEEIPGDLPEPEHAKINIPPGGEQEVAPDSVPIQKERLAAGKGKQGRSAPVFVYLAILFAAAFVMLLLAYLMQQRNNEVAISGLRDTISQFQSLDELRAENAELQEEYKSLEEANRELTDQNESLRSEIREEKNLNNEYFDELACWRDFWELEINFQQGNYEICAQMLMNFSTSNYYVTPNEAAARAEEIYNGLLELGYLTEDDPVRY